MNFNKFINKKFSRRNFFQYRITGILGAFGITKTFAGLEETH